MAQAILLKDVDGLGEAGRRRRRLARLPAQLPGPAQARPGRRRPPRRGRAAAARAGGAGAAREQEERSQETAALLSKTVLTIPHQAGEDGRLFGTVTAKEIVDAIKQARGLRIDKRSVRLDAADQGAWHAHGRDRGRPPDVVASVKTMVVDQR